VYNLSRQNYGKTHRQQIEIEFRRCFVYYLSELFFSGLAVSSSPCAVWCRENSQVEKGYQEAEPTITKQVPAIPLIKRETAQKKLIK
jgi:hypothetical protein